MIILRVPRERHLSGASECGDDVRIGDEDEARVSLDDLADVAAEAMSQVAEDGEGGDAREERGAGVEDADDEAVPVDTDEERQEESKSGSVEW